MSADTIQTPQERALGHVAGLSSGPPVDPAPRVPLNLHPDRQAHGRPILEALAQDGVYLSQFVTGTSNGGLTAHPGGDRWRWESRIFNGAYDTAASGERSVYGALNCRGPGPGPLLPRHRRRGRRSPSPLPGGVAPGFRLTVQELRLHPAYRGQEYVDLGARIAVDGRLDPRIVGAAAGTGRHDPQAVKKVRIGSILVKCACSAPS